MKMNKLWILGLLLINIIILVACNNSTKKEYTITWKNENGEILKINTNVVEGTLPIYNGNTPIKETVGGKSYAFIGWTPEIVVATKDMTYTAMFSETVEQYTITWKNENGDILETDSNVLYGTMPSYNGTTPVKTSNDETKYLFIGWTPEVKFATSDCTYTAVFKEINNGQEVPGVNPVFSEDGTIVEYGFYPQTHISEEEIIEKLNLLENPEVNGWYSYNDEYYTKITANIYNNENYTFEDGTIIINGNEYWFKCEPIKWQVIENHNGLYVLLSTILLDTSSYYVNYITRTINDKIIYANNYEHSEIRNWLNSEFYNIAFINNSYIKVTNVDNSSQTSDSQSNQYGCNNTNDKVYLLSYQEYLNLGNLECKTTDYARARGAWCYTKTALGTSTLYNGTYWTRTPTSEYYYCAWNINSGGYMSAYTVDGKSHCVRPCITISFLD